MKPASAPTVGEVLDAVEAAIARGEIARAERWLAEVQAAAPLHPRGYHLAAFIHRAAGKPGPAIDQLRRSLVLHPNNPVAASQIGVLLRDRNDLAQALEAQIHANRLAPGHPDLLYNLANIQFDVSRFAEAKKALAQALNHAPLDQDSHRLLARIRLGLRDLPGAETSAQCSVILAPGSTNAYITASTVAWENDERTLAWRRISRSLLTNPLTSDGLANRVRQALENGRDWDAITTSRRAVLASPANLSHVLDHAGAVLAGDGRLCDSWKWALCLSRMDPGIFGTLTVFRDVRLEELFNPEKRPPALAFRLPDNRAPAATENHPFLLTVRNATVLPRSQTVLTADGALLHDGISPPLFPTGLHPGNTVFHRTPRGQAVARKINPALKVKEAVLLGVGSGGNYYHWLIDYLLRLYTLSMHEASQTASAPLLVSDDCPAPILELAGLLEIGKDRLTIVPRDAPCLVETLHVPAMPSLAPPFLADALGWIRTRLSGAFAESSGGERVYFDRRGAKQRQLLNADAVESLLAGQGFHISTPAPDSIRKQIAAVSQARTIVSVHGAALANMIFAPAGCEIVELSYPGAPAHLGILARALGHGYKSITCSAIPVAGLRPGRWNLIAPISELSSALQPRRAQ